MDRMMSKAKTLELELVRWSLQQREREIRELKSTLKEKDIVLLKDLTNKTKEKVKDEENKGCTYMYELIKFIY